MTKYDNETRIAVVKAIEAGLGIKPAARLYGIERTRIRNWYRQYIAGGVEQLIGQNQHYTFEQKIQAIEFRWQNELSYSQVAASLGIPSSSSIRVWEQIYLEQGIDGLQDTMKGRPPRMSKAPKPKKSREPITHEQQLEAENARLRMENDYLKKLNALVQEREKSEKKTK